MFTSDKKLLQKFFFVNCVASSQFLSVVKS